MAKGYWVASVDVSDFEDYKNYIAENQNAFRKFGARYVARGGKSEVVEGKGRSRIVVIEFKDYATALACYRSPGIRQGDRQAAQQRRGRHHRRRRL